MSLVLLLVDAEWSKDLAGAPPPVGRGWASHVTIRLQPTGPGDQSPVEDVCALLARAAGPCVFRRIGWVEWEGRIWMGEENPWLETIPRCPFFSAPTRTEPLADVIDDLFKGQAEHMRLEQRAALDGACGGKTMMMMMKLLSLFHT